MPHVILEHSADVAETHDMQAFCDTLFDVLAATEEVTNPASLKIRTHPCPAWRTGTEPGNFVHAMLLMLPGRSDAQQKVLVQTILQTLTEQMPEVGSLSVNMGILDANYDKRVL